MELATFCTDECYVYANIPPSDAAGYRALTWDVEHWTQVAHFAQDRLKDCSSEGSSIEGGHQGR